MRVPPILPLALAAVVTCATTAQAERFTLGIARFDGSIVPFAAHADGRWETVWPPPGQSTGAVPSVDRIPSAWRRRGEKVPPAWRVWPASGGAPVQARVSGPTVVEAHCEGQIALQTDMPKADGKHGRKFGLAVDSSIVQIGAIHEIGRDDAAWGSAERAIIAAFGELERSQAARDRRQLPNENPPPNIRVLYKEAKRASSPVYFVAERKYRAPHSPQDPTCATSTVITGWLAASDAGTYVVLSSRVFLTDCDQKEVRTALPLGAIHEGGRTFWIIQEHGYEDETYIVADIQQKEVQYVIEVNGGGC